RRAGVPTVVDLERDDARRSRRGARRRRRPRRPLLRAAARSQLKVCEDSRVTDEPRPGRPERSERPVLVPRFSAQGFGDEEVALRRAWLAQVTGCALPTIGASAIPGPAMRGNVENPIGSVPVPLGVAGPLLVRGEHAQGTFYVPLATTEGALVRSYERGMVAVTRAGGAFARVMQDENRATPVFSFGSVEEAVAFARALPALTDELRQVAEAT